MLPASPYTRPYSTVIIFFVIDLYESFQIQLKIPLHKKFGTRVGFLQPNLLLEFGIFVFFFSYQNKGHIKFLHKIFYTYWHTIETEMRPTAFGFKLVSFYDNCARYCSQPRWVMPPRVPFDSLFGIFRMLLYKCMCKTQ